MILMINSNITRYSGYMLFSLYILATVGVEGLLSVYLWTYGLTSIKSSDDSTRAARPSVYGSTARINLISFIMKMNWCIHQKFSTNQPFKNRMLLYSNHFSSRFIPNSVASSLIRTASTKPLNSLPLSCWYFSTYCRI